MSSNHENEGGSAFPVPIHAWENERTGYSESVGGDPGMSLLEWYAGMAMKGLLSNPRALDAAAKASRGDMEAIAKDVAEKAHCFAKAMMKEMGH